MTIFQIKRNTVKNRGGTAAVTEDKAAIKPLLIKSGKAQQRMIREPEDVFEKYLQRKTSPVLRREGLTNKKS